MAYCKRHDDTPGTYDPNLPGSDDCSMCRVEKRMREVWNALVPRDPNYRYFEHRGWWYCWTTERMPDGKFAAFIYKPIGRGARSGNARSMKLVKEIRFVQRNTAKARALRWLKAAKARSA